MSYRGRRRQGKRTKGRRIESDDLTDLYAPVRRLAPSQRKRKTYRRAVDQERSSFAQPLNERQEAALEIVRELGLVTAKTIAVRLDVTPSTASGLLYALSARNLIVRAGHGWTCP